MNGTKIFAGARLRRIRNTIGLNQAALAQSLGISPSYLNLIERDQRPITAQILLHLHSLHGVNIAELTSDGEQSGALASLKEVMADPLLSSEIPVPTELTQAQDVAPNLVGATIKLYGAYREVLKRLADMSQSIAATGGAIAETGFESVQSFLHENPLHPSLENLAEEIWFDLSPKDDVFAGIKARLRAGSGIDVRIIPLDIMQSDRARYDRHSQRLFISESLSPPDRLMEAALLLASLEGRAVCDAIISTTPFAQNAESARLLRMGLFKLLAVAILCPTAKFSAAAQDLKFDLEALANRFNLGAIAIMKRLAIVSLRETSPMAIGYLCVDTSGAIIDRVGKPGFHVPRSSALCGQLPHFTGDKTSRLELANGQAIIMVARREGHLAATLSLAPEHLPNTAFAIHTTRSLGSTCRLCEIKNCNVRREPPATRPAALNEFIRGASDFEPV